jgi:hypothetical protein
LSTHDAVGLVVGTVAATPLQFSVAISADQYLQLDDVVVTRRSLPGQPPVQVSGVVTNVEAVHEGARFASDVFLIQQGALPAEVAEVAQVTVTRVEPEVYVPPIPGAPVQRATGPQRDAALYFDEMGEAKVPVGFGRDGLPVYVNFEFVDGTRGAHVSISGVSGIATKTSFALFLLHSILGCGVLGSEAHNTKMLVFSVKGEDLLFLDYANARISPDDRKKYEALGLQPSPFPNVRVFAPPRAGDAAGTPDVTARDQAVSPFYWTLEEFCAGELLPFVFADAEDERAQYTMLIGQVAARLRRDHIRAGDDGAVRIQGVDPASDTIIRSFGDLVTLLGAEHGDDTAPSAVCRNTDSDNRAGVSARAGLTGYPAKHKNVGAQDLANFASAHASARWQLRQRPEVCVTSENGPVVGVHIRPDAYMIDANEITEQTRVVPLGVIQAAAQDHYRLAGYLKYPECRLEGRVSTVDDHAEAVTLGNDLAAGEPADP